MGFDLESLSLAGRYTIDSSRSSSLEEVLRLQEYGWILRKLANKFATSLTLEIEYNEEKMIQRYISAVKTSEFVLQLNWSGSLVNDSELGEVRYTASFSEDNKVLHFETVKEGKFVRKVTWRRIDDKTIENIINVKTNAGEEATSTRVFVSV